jgi:hypothetical protein
MTPGPWVVFAIASAAAFQVSVDATIAVAAFPALRSSFSQTSPATLSWVLNAYALWAPGRTGAAIDMMLFADRTFALVTVASFVSGIAFSLMFLSSFLVLLGIWGYAQGLIGLAVAVLCLPRPRQSGRIALQTAG